MLTVLIAHGLAAIVSAVWARKVGPKIFLVAALGPLSGVALLAMALPSVLHGKALASSSQWIPGLDLSLAFRLDGLSSLMLVLVSGLGSVIFTYTAWYAYRDHTLTRLVWQLTAFAGAMFGLVLADDVILLYVFWELTTIFSYLLVGLDDGRQASRRAARQALIITATGGLVMLAGLLILANQVDSTQISTIVQTSPNSAITHVGLALLLVGALTKSAQVPFHGWLPGAMAAPTPVSAYLHAAAMVKAGIYLVARFTPMTSDISWWTPTVATFGIATMIIGGWRATRQHDLKTLLAFSTVSQLGFLMLVAGWGTPKALAALCVLLLAHGFAKAALFMTVGIVDHQTTTRDLRELSGFGRRVPAVAVLAGCAAASMAGVPPLLGFVAKESVLTALVTSSSSLQVSSTVMWASVTGVILGSILTVAYSLRFWWGAFASKDLPTFTQGDVPPDPDARPAHANKVGANAPRPSWGMSAPMGLAALAGVGLGVAPGALNHLTDHVVTPLDAQFHTHFALWHGVNLELVLSGVALLCGFGLFAARRRWGVLQRSVNSLLPQWVNVETLFNSWMRQLTRFARSMSALMQTGSLPLYLTSIIVTVVTLPSIALIMTTDLSTVQAPALADRAQWPVVIVITICALMAASATTRTSAVMFLGATGYGVALLFVIQGAPDLAMTQFLVETLSLVIFLLVLRLLPQRFPTQVKISSQIIKALIAAASGIFVTAFTLIAAGSRTAMPVSTEHVQRSYSEGHGSNIVNVILVDFRGLDTLGEVTVVLTAALGIMALVLTAKSPSATAESGSRLGSILHSEMLNTVVRWMFFPIIAVGIYALLAGHNRPGGGFIGGLITSSAFVLRYLAAGPYPKKSQVGRPEIVLGIGLALASAVATVPMLFGYPVMTSFYHAADLPIVGKVSFTTVLLFDTGVDLIVIGIVLAILRSLGARKASALGQVPPNQQVFDDLAGKGRGAKVKMVKTR